ncbi:MAG: hypothetical protein IPP77_11155 [Bacteroidetes bacterium]|nr:hypothetical protein [Bacteroidota bacterium]
MMKRILIAILIFISINTFLSSCSKCAVCKIAGMESNKMCKKDDSRTYRESKKICEEAGGIWDEQ